MAPERRPNLFLCLIEIHDVPPSRPRSIGRRAQWQASPLPRSAGWREGGAKRRAPRSQGLPERARWHPALPLRDFAARRPLGLGAPPPGAAQRASAQLPAPPLRVGSVQPVPREAHCALHPPVSPTGRGSAWLNLYLKREANPSCLAAASKLRPPQSWPPGTTSDHSAPSTLRRPPSPRSLHLYHLCQPSFRSFCRL